MLNRRRIEVRSVYFSGHFWTSDVDNLEIFFDGLPFCSPFSPHSLPFRLVQLYKKSGQFTAGITRCMGSGGTSFFCSIPHNPVIPSSARILHLASGLQKQTEVLLLGLKPTMIQGLSASEETLLEFQHT